MFNVRGEHPTPTSFDIFTIGINTEELEPTVSGQRNADDALACSNNFYHSAINVRLPAHGHASRIDNLVRCAQTASRNPIDAQMPIARAFQRGFDA